MRWKRVKLSNNKHEPRRALCWIILMTMWNAVDGAAGFCHWRNIYLAAPIFDWVEYCDETLTHSFCMCITWSDSADKLSASHRGWIFRWNVFQLDLEFLLFLAEDFMLQTFCCKCTKIPYCPVNSPPPPPQWITPGQKKSKRALYRQPQTPIIGHEKLCPDIYVPKVNGPGPRDEEGRGVRLGLVAFSLLAKEIEHKKIEIMQKK